MIALWSIALLVVTLLGILFVISLWTVVLLVSALWREWRRNVLLRDGEADLLALIALLVEELRQRVLGSLVAGFTAAEGFEHREDGIAERECISLVESCHVVAGCAVGFCMDDRKTCCIEHTICNFDGVERHGYLVMEHRHDAIKLVVVLAAEEFFCRVRTECLDALVGECVDGRDDDVALLGAAALVLVDAWVEGEHGDAWVGDEEVALQGLPEQGSLLGDSLCGDCLWYLCHWDSSGDGCKAQVVAKEEGQGMVAIAQTGFDIVFVILEGVALYLDILVAYRSRDEHIVEAVAIVGHGTVECLDCCCS